MTYGISFAAFAASSYVGLLFSIYARISVLLTIYRLRPASVEYSSTSTLRSPSLIWLFGRQLCTLRSSTRFSEGRAFLFNI